MDVFSTNLVIEDFYSIIENKDLETLMEVGPPKRMIWSPDQQIRAKSRAIPTSFKEKPTEETTKPVYTKHVKSVGKIRQKFELEQLAKWPHILQRKDNFFYQLRQNKRKSNVKEIVQPVLDDDSPLTRLSWKIMCDLNPKSQKYRQQFMQCTNGKKVLLSGSLGGRIELYKEPRKMRPVVKKTKMMSKAFSSTKKELLSSMSMPFKPGPLSRKVTLKDSNKNSCNKIELVELPAIGIEVFPQLGVRLDSAVCARLEQARRPDGLMDASWAMFAASVVKQSDKESQCHSHTFPLPYKHNQSKILMQRDPDKSQKFSERSLSPDQVLLELEDLGSNLSYLNKYYPTDDAEATVKNMLVDMIKATALGAIQDNIAEPDLDYNPEGDASIEPYSKSDSLKPSKRKYSELKRLDVTVIDVSNDNVSKLCCNNFCRLGCVCASLQTPVIFNDHCGQPECMFKCTCHFNKNNSYSTNTDVTISDKAVFNLQHQMNRFLSKEERKFRRTVIHANDNTIVLGASPRTLRKPKRSEDFVSYDDPELSTSASDVKVVLHKLPKSMKLEPWCMTHQLYKCFCKNKLCTGHGYRFSYLNAEHSDPVDSKTTKESNSERYIIAPDTCSRTTAHSDQRKETKVKNIVKIQEKEKLLETKEKNIMKIQEKGKLLEAKEKNIMNVQEQEKLLMTKEKESIENIPKSVVRISIDDETDVNYIRSILCDERFKPRKLENMSNDDCSRKTKQILPSQSRKMIKLVKKSVSNQNQNQWFLQPPLPNLRKVLCWNYFLSCFSKGEVLIWASVNAPYKLYATLQNEVRLSDTCINITHPDFQKYKWHLYPPLLQQILSKNCTACKFILLIGKTFAWQISGMVNSIISRAKCVSLEKSFKDNQHSQIHATPQIVRVQGSHQLKDRESAPKTSQNDSNTSLELWKLLPSQPNATITSQIESQVISTASENIFKSCPSPELSDEMESQPDNQIHQKALLTLPIHTGKFNRWMLLTLENDFLQLKIISRGVTVLYSNLIIGINEARSQKKISRVRGVELVNTDDIFQIYGVPNTLKMQVCMGPFKKDEKANLQIVSNGGSRGGKHTKGIWLYNKIDKLNESICNQLDLVKQSVPTSDSSPSAKKLPHESVNNPKPNVEQLDTKPKVSSSDQLLTNSQSPEKKVVVLKGKQFVLKKIANPVKTDLQRKIVNILKIKPPPKSLLKLNTSDKDQNSLRVNSKPSNEKDLPRLLPLPLLLSPSPKKHVPVNDTTKMPPLTLISNQRRKQTLLSGENSQVDSNTITVQPQLSSTPESTEKSDKDDPSRMNKANKDEPSRMNKANKDEPSRMNKDEPSRMNKANIDEDMSANSETQIKTDETKIQTPMKQPRGQKCEKLTEVASQENLEVQNDKPSVEENQHPTLPHSYILKYLSKLEGDIQHKENEEEKIDINDDNGEDGQTSDDDDVIFLPQKQEVVEVLDSDEEEAYVEERLEDEERLEEEEDMYEEERLEEEFLKEDRIEEGEENMNMLFKPETAV